MTLTITDLFCGGGGSSTGAIQVPGVEIRIAANPVPWGDARWCAFRQGYGPCDCPDFPMPERDQ